MSRGLLAHVVALVVSSSSFAAVAHAEVGDDAEEPAPAPAPARSRVEPEAVTYPLRIVGADVASAAAFGVGGFLLVAAALGDSSGPAVPGLVLVTASVVGYAVVPPLLHLRTGNPRGAMRSALARAGLPLVGATLAYASDRANDERPIYGAVAGMGVAMVLDWTVFARMPAKTTLLVAPSADGGMQANLVGRF